MDSDGKNGESNLWDDEFPGFEICSIQKEKKSWICLLTLKDHGCFINLLLFCVFKRVRQLIDNVVAS